MLKYLKHLLLETDVETDEDVVGEIEEEIEELRLELRGDNYIKLLKAISFKA